MRSHTLERRSAFEIDTAEPNAHRPAQGGRNDTTKPPKPQSRAIRVPAVKRRRQESILTVRVLHSNAGRLFDANSCLGYTNLLAQARQVRAPGSVLFCAAGP
jgi:hypothetical protein